MEVQSDVRSSSNDRLLAVAAVGVLAIVVLIRNAWLADDAYISFRVVDNLVHGFGLRWNVDERVQTFTNPLWTLLLSIPYALTHEIYYTSLITSIAMTALTICLVARDNAATPWATLFAGLALLLSKSFIDYGVSGLENPLTYLLLAIFWSLFLKNASPRWIYFVAALALVDRLDNLLLMLPALAAVLLGGQRSLPSRALDLFVGFLPFIAWELFSLAYYGFLLPNTYYAKVNTGIPAMEYARQGLLYLVDLAQVDPIAVAAILLALPLAVIRGDRREQSMGAGLVLHVLYVVRVGGDFMAGRFLTTCYLTAIILLTRRIQPPVSLVARASLALLLLLGALNPKAAVYSGPNYESAPTYAGICDEKGFYFRESALILDRKNEPPKPETSSVVVDPFIGRRGFAAGPTVHFVDGWAVTEPLLARLPARHEGHWRVGHFERDIPRGYVDAIKTGNTARMDPDLARYYSELKLVISGPLWSVARWKAIWHLNRLGGTVPVGH